MFLFALDKHSEVELLHHIGFTFPFFFFSNFYTLFQSGCANWHSHQERARVRFSKYFLVNTCDLVCLKISSLIGMRWQLFVVLICTFLMTNAVEYLIIDLLAIYKYLEKCLFRFCLQLLIGFYVAFLSCMTSFYSLDIDLLADI